MWVLDITKGTPTDKPLLLFFTRQHPPEVTGYFAFKSFIEELINNNTVAELFLNKFSQYILYEDLDWLFLLVFFG